MGRRSTAGIATSALIAACAGGCTVGPREAALPPRDVAWIAVLSGEMPDAIEQVARHAWIVGSLPFDHDQDVSGGWNGRQTQGVPWRRWEYLGHASRSATYDPFRYFGRGDVAVHGVVVGSIEEIRATMACLDEEAAAYDKRHPTYFPIPGPNSNTFVAEALRHCGLHVELPSTAIGRDYLGPVGAAVTESGTGVQLESWVAGARIGLREGVEGHFAGLALGVHVWPPGITVPVNPGRIGVDLDGHAPPEPPRSDDGSVERSHDRRFGLGVAQMFGTVARVEDPAQAGGLAERATFGLTGRATLAKRDLGYAFGADVDLGMGFPAGFAYGVRLYPAGIAWTFGRTGYVGAFGGFGASGVTAHVTGGLELPVEARAELDAGDRVRLGVRVGTTWVPFVDARRGGSSLPFGDERVVGGFARLGRTENASFDSGTSGRGYFLGLERHEVMHTSWFGITYGVEVDFGG